MKNILQTYFFENDDETPADFAIRIGRSPSTITRLLKGERQPSYELALDIEKGTKGKVKAADLMSSFLALRKRQAA